MRIRERIQALRSLMAERELDAYIIPSSDPHQSEYPPAHWRHRAWVSGFEGSAGTVVVMSDRAGLWTDFRYFLEAEEALAGSGIELYKFGETGVPDYPEWLAAELGSGMRAGFDALSFSLAAARNLEEKLAPEGIAVVPDDDLIGMIWDGRPDLPRHPVMIHDVRFSGRSRGEKVSGLRSSMEQMKADYHAISTLDDIAWLLNIRGSDVPYNPVAVAHLLVSRDAVYLYVDEQQLPPDVRTALESDGVTIRPYGEAASDLAGIEPGNGVIVSPRQISVGIAEQLAEGVRRIEHVNLSTEAKAQKHPVEIDHLRQVMIRDGVAMARFLHWVASSVATEEITELSAEERLRAFRAEGERFVSESFRTISGYRGHGAIVHYSASEQSNARLEPAGLYLVDSGAQYYDGTTDITRTIALGPASEEARRDFTLVLKGHIGLATLQFPVGTTGHMIDAVCREHLWRHRMNYGHGTGHGVGFFLNVHEGPQRISQHPNDVPLKPGMVVSNEPGLYRAEQYGIRTENLLVVVENGTNEFGSFLGFETLTLCPIDRSLIDTTLLSPEERSWVDDYHRRVRELLLGHLEGKTAAWLDAACAPL